MVWSKPLTLRKVHFILKKRTYQVRAARAALLFLHQRTTFVDLRCLELLSRCLNSLLTRFDVIVLVFDIPPPSSIDVKCNGSVN